jgi:hypothetical protein
MQYDNTNSGMMARNERRTTDKHPEFSGSINVEGVDYWLSAWVNEGKAGGKMEGKKYFSIKLSRKETGNAVSSRPASGSSFDYDDDIPF